MKGVLNGGTWDQAEVEVPEIPLEQVIIGIPPVVYNFSRVVDGEDPPVAIYTAHPR